MIDIKMQPTIHELHAGWREGQGSPRETLEGFIDAVDTREHEIHAFEIVDRDGARRQADASAIRHREGRSLSPIDGLVIGVKDNLETVDLPTTFGSPIFKGFQGGRDSAIAYALRASGAVILGKTVTTEFASSFTFADTRNPHDLSRTPGGSSSGSAAAVAAGMLPIAVGTQVIGSILRPAGFNGVIGFKPTYGALNKGGASDAYSQHTLGMLALNIADIWAVCAAVAAKVGGDPGFAPFRGGPVPRAPARPTRLAFVETAGWAVAEDGARDAFAEVRDALERDGVTVLDRRGSRRVELLEQTLVNARDVSLRLCRYEGLWPFADMDLRHRDLFSDNMRGRVDLARDMDPDDYIAALAQREAMRDALLALRGEADAFITLSNTGPAPLGLTSTGNSIFNVPISAPRVPAFSLPLLQLSGLPVGFQLFGFPDHDSALSAVAGYMLDAIKPPSGGG